MKRNLLIRGVLLMLMSGFFYQFTFVYGTEPTKGRTQSIKLSCYPEEEPLQGCVRSISQIIYRAVVQQGIIGKDSVVVQYGDTLFFYPDGAPKGLKTNLPFGLNPQDSISLQYDAFGKCVKRVIYYPNKQLKESQSFLYNEMGKIKLCIIRSTQEEVVDAISYSYDPYGKLAIKIYNRKDGDMHQQRFAYDSKGNWIIRVDFQDYEPVYYVERTILYYDESTE